MGLKEANMLKDHFDDQWKELQQLRPSSSQKDAMRIRIRQSIQVQSSSTIPNRIFQWKSILSACLLFLICASFLWVLLQDRTDPKTVDQPEINFETFSWKLEDVYGEKTSVGWTLYRKNKPLQVGSVKVVEEEEMNKIISSTAMYVNEDLENFPYPIQMYIEHVKMMDVALRYHFFVPMPDEKWVHFSFDYHQVEFAEIFQAMATLEIKGIEPYIHDEQLYVKHGYGNLIFPVGLKPISISSNKEMYRWEKASLKVFNDYLQKIERGNGYLRKTFEKGVPFTLVSNDGNQEVTITLEGKNITYEFYYPNQDQ